MSGANNMIQSLGIRQALVGTNGPCGIIVAVYSFGRINMSLDVCYVTYI